MVRLHHLDAKDEQGRTIRWPEKDPRKKQAAQKKLESNFPVLARCQGNWASEYFLHTHANNKYDKSKTKNAGGNGQSETRLDQAPSQNQNLHRQNSGQTHTQSQHQSRAAAVHLTAATAAPQADSAQLRYPVQVSAENTNNMLSQAPRLETHETDNGVGDSTTAANLSVTASATRAPKKTKTTKGTGKAKKQTKAELEKLYQALLQENQSMRSAASSSSTLIAGQQDLLFFLLSTANMERFIAIITFPFRLCLSYYYSRTAAYSRPHSCSTCGNSNICTNYWPHPGDPQNTAIKYCTKPCSKLVTHAALQH